jgi:hypothetical protein
MGSKVSQEFPTKLRGSLIVVVTVVADWAITDFVPAMNRIAKVRARIGIVKVFFLIYIYSFRAESKLSRDNPDLRSVRENLTASLSHRNCYRRIKAFQSDSALVGC